MSRTQRKQLIVDPPFQITFIVKFCIWVVITSVLIGGFVYFLTRESTTIVIENTKVVVKPTADFILPVLSMTVLSVTVLAGLAVLFLALFISHRIAGPAFRLRREVDALQGGDMNRDFRVRGKDQLQDLSLSLDKMASIFRARHAALKEACRTLEGYLETKNFSVGSKDRDELKKQLDRIHEEMSFFRVK